MTPWAEPTKLPEPSSLSGQCLEGRAESFPSLKKEKAEQREGAALLLTMRKEQPKHHLLSSFLPGQPFSDAGTSNHSVLVGMELQGVLVGSGDGQGQAGTAQLWLPPAHGAEAAACPATVGREMLPFSSPYPARETPVWRTAAARCGCDLCSRGVLAMGT